jgi:hypothetical protein
MTVRDRWGGIVVERPPGRAGDFSHPPPSSLRSQVSLNDAPNSLKIFLMKGESFVHIAFLLKKIA